MSAEHPVGPGAAERVENAHGPKLSPARKRLLAQAFSYGAESYDTIRPGYPRALLEDCLRGLPEAFRLDGEHPLRAADIGSGTGKFALQLLRAGAEVIAVDPSEAFLAVAAQGGLETRLGTGEHTGLPSQSLHLVTYAQSWHWVDSHAAGLEAARLVLPRGRLALIWNQLDVQVPWVHRLSRIMRSGDIFYRPERPPRPGGRWRSPELTVHRFEQQLTPAGVVELARSRSAWRNADAVQKQLMEKNLEAYLCHELNHAPDEPLALPYLSFAWTFTRSSRVDPQHRPENWRAGQTP